MTELALRSDVPGTLTDQMELARVLSTSQLLPSHLAGKPANVLSIMFAAHALGIPLWTAIQGMQVINGKVGINADLARALILNRGHSFRVVESTTEKATVEVVRKGEEYVHSATFTIEDARTAHLAGKGAWVTYPLAMLVARATTLVARQACADVLAGMSYTPEELGADVDEEGRIVGSAPVGEPEGIPRNADGSVSRSRTTDEQKQAAGVMTQAQQKEHSVLANVKDPKKAQRRGAEQGPDLADPWATGVAGPSLSLPDGPAALLEKQLLEELAACVTEQMVATTVNAARKALADERLTRPQVGSLVAAGLARTRELTEATETDARATA